MTWSTRVSPCSVRSPLRDRLGTTIGSKRTKGSYDLRSDFPQICATAPASARSPGSMFSATKFISLSEFANGRDGERVDVFHDLLGGWRLVPELRIQALDDGPVL